MTDTEPNWRAIAKAAVGTTLNPGALAEQFDVDESVVEENLAEEGVETCRRCGWWFEEFPDEDGELPDEPTCEDCLKDEAPE